MFSQASDVWSFAVVAIEAFTDGKPPYEGMSVGDVMKQVPMGLRLKKPPTCPVSLYGVLEKCWAKDPADRPSFSDVIKLIEPIVEFETRSNLRRRNTAFTASQSSPRQPRKNDVLPGNVFLEDSGEKSEAQNQPPGHDPDYVDEVHTAVASSPTVQHSITVNEEDEPAKYGRDAEAATVLDSSPSAPGDARVSGLGTPTSKDSPGISENNGVKNEGSSYVPQRRATVLQRIRTSIKRGIHMLDDDDVKPGRAHITELFFDLIFVAGFYRLGKVLATDVQFNGALHFGEVALFFFVLYLSWTHINMVKTRFELKAPWHVLEYLHMLSVLLLAISTASYVKLKPGDDEPKPVPALGEAAYQGSWIAARAMIVLIYATCAMPNPKARPISSCFCAALLVSISLSVIALVIDSRPAYLALSALAVLIEMSMYGMVLMLLPQQDIPTIDVEHNVERAELWAILVLGESMLSLVDGADEYYHDDDSMFYLDIALGFGVVAVLMRLYARSQPNQHGHDGMDAHAYDVSLIKSLIFDWCQAILTGGFFVLGVGLKFIAKYGHYKEGAYYIRDYAWLISGGAAVALIGMLGSRFAHEWARYALCGGVIPRSAFWITHAVVAVAVIAVALIVPAEHGGDGDEHPDEKATAYLGLVLVFLVLAYVADALSEPHKGIVQQLSVFNEAATRLETGEIEDTEISEQYNKDTIMQAAQKIKPPKMTHQGTKHFRFSSRRASAARQNAGGEGMNAVDFLDEYHRTLVKDSNSDDPLSRSALESEQFNRLAGTICVATADAGLYGDGTTRQGFPIATILKAKQRFREKLRKRGSQTGSAARATKVQVGSVPQIFLA